ncbi:TPA: glycosyltransferase, partial [Escherichia coli]
YLREQLNSILNQNADNFSIDIYVRDDGSNNVNLVNLRQMTSCLPINVFEGSNIGVTKSFFTLLEQVDSYDYYAFCDQDDVWLDDKISSAVTMMKDSEGPVLYCSAYTLVDA